MGPSRASDCLVWSSLIPNCSHDNCCCPRKAATGELLRGRRVLSTCAGGLRGHSAWRGSLWPGNPFCHGSLPPPLLNPWNSLSTLHKDPGLFSSTSNRNPCYSPAPPFGPSLTSPGAQGPRRSQSPQASRSTISAPRRNGGSNYGGTSGSKRELPPGPSYRLGRRSRGDGAWSVPWRTF